MKKIVLLVAFFTTINLFAVAQAKSTPPIQQKKDTVRDLRNLHPTHFVKSRDERIALQKKQIKRHKEQAKKIKDMQAELDKETNGTH